MILSGWKEIAGYLHCGIRTVQRWEMVGLPVHRPAPRTRGHVIAHSEELDHWVRGKRFPKPDYSGIVASITNAKRLQGEAQARVLDLQERVKRLRDEVAELYARKQRNSPPPRLSNLRNLDELRA
jgi:hypothetical protein